MSRQGTRGENDFVQFDPLDTTNSHLPRRLQSRLARLARIDRGPVATGAKKQPRPQSAKAGEKLRVSGQFMS